MNSHATNSPLMWASDSGSGQSSKVIMKKSRIWMHLQNVMSFPYLGMMVFRCVCGW